jgi:hypothetical protein
LVDWDDKEKFRQTFTDIIQAMQDEEMIELKNSPTYFNINWLGLHPITLVPSFVLLFVPILKQPSVFFLSTIQFIEQIL